MYVGWWKQNESQMQKRPLEGSTGRRIKPMTVLVNIMRKSDILKM